MYKIQLTNLTENEKIDLYLNGKTIDEKILIGNKIIKNRLEKYKKNIDLNMIYYIKHEIKILINKLKI